MRKSGEIAEIKRPQYVEEVYEPLTGEEHLNWATVGKAAYWEIPEDDDLW